MRVSDIISLMESWAPKWSAWSKDNVGLQVGDPDRIVRRVLVALDVTPAVIQEAVRKRIDLIVSHHPLLFRQPSSITTRDAVGAMILQLAERKISVFAAHTNLDFARDGVSFALARKLGLREPKFLVPLKDTLAKIIVFVPESHCDRVRTAMANAGAGIIGEYSTCSFTSRGRGTFVGSDATHPYVGSAGTLEVVDEVRLEMVVPRAETPKVVRAMRSVHPYEEPAFDIMQLENASTTAGMGALGALDRPVNVKAFLQSIRKALRPAALRHTVASASRIQSVAVCSGSGSDLLEDAIRAGADAFVTADVRYHGFHAAEGRILLIDAGHWETENVIVPVIAAKLKAAARMNRASIEVIISQQSTNPVRNMLLGPA